MIQVRRLQRSFGEGLIAEAVDDLWEDWMRHADELLEDESLINTVYEGLALRCPRSKTFGRRGIPAEVVLRMLLLKHVRDWSYEILVREVRANLVYRQFTRVGSGSVPDDKSLGRLARTLGADVVEQIHQRIVTIAQEKKVVQGKRMRVDTTVVETTVHYPTDSTLLGDGVRVLTRTMKKIAEVTGGIGTKLRNRLRNVQHRLIEIGRASRSKSAVGKEKLKQAYVRLMNSTEQVVKQAQRFSAEVASGVKSALEVKQQMVLEGCKQYLDAMIPLVQQVILQTQARVLEGITNFDGKLFSIFEPTTEIIRKGKAGKPNEFGKMVKIQEAENQIVTAYEVYTKRPVDADLLIPAITAHQEQLGRTPRLVAGDAGFYSAQNETKAHQAGVEQVAIPNHSTKSAARKRHQKKRWFRKGQKWRTGSEGRISLLKRRHGLHRSRYKGDSGMKKWVGFGVIADNLINIGAYLASQTK